MQHVSLEALAPTIHADENHFGWDRALPPRIGVIPGHTLELELVDASGGQLRPESTSEDVGRVNPDRVNPLAGPIEVEGAEPGDALIVDILAFDPSGWGWTGIVPGFGLLSDEIEGPYFHLSHYDRQRVDFLPGLEIPFRPMIGTIGVAPAAPGPHHVIPPRRVGGNLDCRDITTGTRVHLPVEVEGAMLSLGDAHAAQGDGEVCGTAVETPMGVEVRVELEKGAAPRAPTLDIFETTLRRSDRGFFVTTGVDPDLREAARDAVRAMIDRLMTEHGLSAEQAYCLCSVTVDLRVTEIVNDPNHVVSAYLPRDPFA